MANVPTFDVNSGSHPTFKVNVLIASDDVTFLYSLSETLSIRLPTLSITTCISAQAAIRQINAISYDAVVSEFKLLITNTQQLLTTLGATQPPLPLVVVCEIQEYRQAVAALGQEAYDIIPQPISWEYFVQSLRSAIHTHQINLFKANQDEQQSLLNNHHLLQGLKVLLVDDDADGKEVEKTILASFGAEVLALCSVQAALIQLEQF